MKTGSDEARSGGVVPPEWKIDRPREVCAGCAAPFAEGDLLYSGIFLDGQAAGGYRRQDRCASCWETVAATAFARWKTRFAPRSTDAKPPRVDLDALLEFLQRLRSSDRPADTALAYVLALYLVRKRRLVVEGTAGAGRDVRIVMRTREPGGERFEVADLAFDEAALAGAEGSLGAILAGAAGSEST